SNAGSYSDTWTFAGNANYQSASGTITDSIGKASAAFSVSPYNVIYNGASHTALGSATGVSGESLNGLLDLTPTTHSNAGSYTDTWAFAGNANYQSASGTITDTIGKA